MVREKIRESRPQESEEQMSRLDLLLKLLQRCGEDYYEEEEKDGEINDLIDFLCTASTIVFFYLLTMWVK